jgi:geranylgeranyl diphosphate synthase type II
MLGTNEQKMRLVDLMTDHLVSEDEKVKEVKILFNTSGASEATKLAVKDYTEKAFGVLESLNLSKDKKQILKQFGNQLMNRHV